MATLESTPPVSTSPSSTDNVPGTPSVSPYSRNAKDAQLREQALEKELALLQDRFAALEHKFSALHGKDITITENTLGEVTKLTVDAVCSYPCRDNTRYAEGQDDRLIDHRRLPRVEQRMPARSVVGIKCHGVDNI